MPDGLSLPVICVRLRARLHLRYGVAYGFGVTLPRCSSLVNEGGLNEDEKRLWLWLATTCANNQSLTCSLTYEQISNAVNKPVKDIHRILFRLKIMGLLMGNIPIWYGAPTVEMVNEMRNLRLKNEMVNH